MITYAIGQRLTAELLQELADYTVNAPIVRLVQATAQSLASGATTPITFAAGSTVLDTNDFHSEATNPSRVTPTVAGIYEVSGVLALASSGAVTGGVVSIGLNGSEVPTSSRMGYNATAAIRTYPHAPVQVECNGTSDYIELRGVQNAGVALNTAVTPPVFCTLTVKFLRPA